MKILAIDPGTRCGWATKHGDSWASGVWDLTSKRHEGGGMRFLRLRKYLREVLDIFQPDALVYEEVRMHMGVDAAHVYGGVVAVLSEECESRKIPYTAVHFAHVKKLATGKGNAGKEQMMLAAQTRWPGYEFADDNEADARWIAEQGALEIV